MELKIARIISRPLPELILLIDLGFFTRFIGSIESQTVSIVKYDSEYIGHDNRSPIQD